MMIKSITEYSKSIFEVIRSIFVVIRSKFAGSKRINESIKSNIKSSKRII